MILFSRRKRPTKDAGSERNTGKSKTWFGMPRWSVMVFTAIVVLGAISIIAIAGLDIRPIDILPQPTPRETPEEITPGENVLVDLPSPPVETPADIWDEYDRKEDVYTIVLAGTDQQGANTDVLMVAALDVKNSTLDVISIPRDTQVNVTRRIRKINGAWSYGGIDKLNEELCSIIGFIPDTYAVVDLRGFVKLVDAIGGVDYDVPRNMHYIDTDQNLYINLQKGFQHLDGAHAIQLVRFRDSYVGGDFDRIPVIQDFLKAVVRQTLRLENIFKINEFADIASEHLSTGMDTGQIIWFLQELMKLKEEDVNFYLLPVDVGFLYQKEDYALVKVEDALDLINQTINPFRELRTEADLDVSRLWDTQR